MHAIIYLLKTTVVTITHIDYSTAIHCYSAQGPMNSPGPSTFLPNDIIN